MYVLAFALHQFDHVAEKVCMRGSRLSLPFCTWQRSRNLRCGTAIYRRAEPQREGRGCQVDLAFYFPRRVALRHRRRPCPGKTIEKRNATFRVAAASLASCTEKVAAIYLADENSTWSSAACIFYFFSLPWSAHAASPAFQATPAAKRIKDKCWMAQEGDERGEKDSGRRGIFNRRRHYHHTSHCFLVTHFAPKSRCGSAAFWREMGSRCSNEAPCRVAAGVDPESDLPSAVQRSLLLSRWPGGEAFVACPTLCRVHEGVIRERMLACRDNHLPLSLGCDASCVLASTVANFRGKPGAVLTCLKFHIRELRTRSRSVLPSSVVCDMNCVDLRFASSILRAV